MRKRKSFLRFWLFIFLAVSAIYVYRSFAVQRTRILKRRKARWVELKQALKDEVMRFRGEAGIVIRDLDMHWEISLHKEKLFASASLVKVPIMAAVFQAAHERAVDLEEQVALLPSYKINGSGVLKNMPTGSVFSVEKLMEYMISESDNTAANMLIDLLGFDYLNAFFREAGLKNTNLTRLMMDFRHRRRGIDNYTTPQDMADLLEKIYRKSLISRGISEKCLKLLKQQNINDRIPRKLPAGTPVADKTGLERDVCHDIGIVFTPKGNFLICVLTKKAINRKVAKEFIAAVSLHAYNYFQER